MFRIFLIAAFVGLACCLRSDLNDLWNSYKSQHSKIYKPRMESLRRSIWESNLRVIEQHNILADRGVYSFRMGENEYTDMTNEEFRHVMNGLKLTNQTYRNNHVQFVPTAMDLPSEVDWRTKGYITDVKNQLGCGSCWAFSSTGALEGQLFKKTKKLISLSEQNLVDCTKDYGNFGCSGGYMTNAFKYIKENKGIDTEQGYPYVGIDEPCRFKRDVVGGEDTGSVDIKSGSEEALQQAAVEIGPISVAIDADHDSFQFYKSGVYYEPECNNGPSDLDHAVLVVGYGTEDGQDYWLIKNSWGTSWGEKGYFKLARNKSNHCGVATLASYPTV
ncbi:hypothetical protein Btru_054690 [Bulinus truncatus]|nr:hypothetical protein Btru_054690 [Bulinus truncatus]